MAIGLNDVRERRAEKSTSKPENKTLRAPAPQKANAPRTAARSAAEAAPKRQPQEPARRPRLEPEFNDTIWLEWATGRVTGFNSAESVRWYQWIQQLKELESIVLNIALEFGRSAQSRLLSSRQFQKLLRSRSKVRP